MRASELEGSAVVIEGGRFPGVGSMAGLAICTELAVMGIIPAVAGDTGAGGAFETVGMA